MNYKDCPKYKTIMENEKYLDFCLETNLECGCHGNIYKCTKDLDRFRKFIEEKKSKNG